MTIEQKIFYYKQTKWNITFRFLHHCVLTVCDLVKPIYPNVEPLKYFEYFFSEIDFDKLDNEATKTETLKYCNSIYIGLEQLLKADVSNEILNYQNNISKLSYEQMQETQIKIVVLIGNLKRQTRTNTSGISFTQRYNSLYNSIMAKERLYSIDYQILISHFGETISNDLLSSFEIINETFKEILPLLKALPPQQTETETDKGTPIFVNNFDKITPTEIYKHFKAGLVEKQYLTEQELNEYLKAAFELKTIPEILFKIKDAPKKATIEAVFYEYYKNVAGKIHGKQNQYAALLGDYFDGYKTTTVSSNFSKSVY